MYKNLPLYRRENTRYSVTPILAKFQLPLAHFWKKSGRLLSQPHHPLADARTRIIPQTVNNKWLYWERECTAGQRRRQNALRNAENESSCRTKYSSIYTCRKSQTKQKSYNQLKLCQTRLAVTTHATLCRKKYLDDHPFHRCLSGCHKNFLKLQLKMVYEHYPY